jgi:uncharacterized protein
MTGTFAMAIGLAASGGLAMALLYRLQPPAAGNRHTRLLGGALVLLGLVLAPFSFSRSPAGVCDRQASGQQPLTAALCTAIHASPAGVSAVRVVVGAQPLQVEIVDTPPQRARGLMFRRSLAPRHGMLFVYGRDQRDPFWMKNTKIPLDMLFFDHRGRLQDVLRDVPPCKVDPCPSYWPSHSYRYVIELPAGEARRLDLRAGARLAPAAGKP